MSAKPAYIEASGTCAAHHTHHIGSGASLHHFHHFFHVFELFEQTVYLLYRPAGTCGYAVFARRIHKVRVAAFLGSHGLYYRFDMFERVVGYVYIFYGLAHAGEHAEDILHVAQLLYLRYLAQKIIESELVLAEFALQFACFFLVVLGIDFFYQGYDIAHA